MSDIFDDVSEGLKNFEDEVAASETDITSAMTEDEDLPEDQNFNEAELEDIMAEIENLEKEFEIETNESETEDVAIMDEPVAEIAIEAKEAVTNAASVKKTELQTQIDRELEMSFIEKEEEELDKQAPAVLPFENKQTAAVTTNAIAPKASEISFEANGQMSLNLGFKIGEDNAQLTIDPVKGLVVTMSGVKLTISHEDGCVVSMENGVKFSIPLSSVDTKQKKKSA
jgi:hypothetical protein